MSVESRPDELEVGRRLAGLGLREPWWTYLGFGGNQLMNVLQQELDGTLPISDIEHDMIAHAINEEFVDLGGDHPIPYWLDVLSANGMELHRCEMRGRGPRKV